MSKATRKRACPAVGRDISPAECGEHRTSRYSCPADCPYSPFTLANYDIFQSIEATTIHKAIDWVRRDAPSREEFDRLEQAARRAATLNALAAFHLWRFAGLHGADGLPSVERWGRAGFPGLSNDERVVARARGQLQPVVLEVLRVLDDLRIEVVDLLDPARPRLVLADRGFAARAARFAVLLTWIYPLPHYWRVAGTAELLPGMGDYAGDEIVRELVQHLGGPTEVPALRRWLLEHLVRLDEALMAVSLARRKRMFADMDATFGKAVYELQAPLAECRARLDSFPRGEREEPSAGDRAEGFEETRVWFAEQSTTGVEATGAQPVLGRVLLQPTHWRVETMGGKRFARLREAFEGLMGNLVTFKGERLDDLAAQMRLKDEPYDASLVPPRLLEGTEQMIIESSRMPVAPASGGGAGALNRALQAQARTFLDNPVPRLGGQTPREAAQNPELRPKLLRMMKERIRAQDEENLRTGRADSLDWMLRELGLEEISFAPPPPRAPLKSLGEPTDADEDADLSGEWADDLPPAPPLSREPLSAEETARRVSAMMAQFESGQAAVEALGDSGVTILEDLQELAGDRLNQREQNLLTSSALLAWFVLVPPGCAPPAVDFEDLQAEFLRVLKVLQHGTGGGAGAGLDHLTNVCDQPQVLAIAALEMLHESKHGQRPERPREASALLITVLLLALVNVVHQALVEP